MEPPDGRRGGRGSSGGGGAAAVSLPNRTLLAADRAASSKPRPADSADLRGVGPAGAPSLGGRVAAASRNGDRGEAAPPSADARTASAALAAALAASEPSIVSRGAAGVRALRKQGRGRWAPFASGPAGAPRKPPPLAPPALLPPRAAPDRLMQPVPPPPHSPLTWRARHRRARRAVPASQARRVPADAALARQPTAAHPRTRPRRARAMREPCGRAPAGTGRAASRGCRASRVRVAVRPRWARRLAGEGAAVMAAAVGWSGEGARARARSGALAPPRRPRRGAGDRTARLETHSSLSLARGRRDGAPPHPRGRPRRRLLGRGGDRGRRAGAR